MAWPLTADLPRLLGRCGQPGVDPRKPQILASAAVDDGEIVGNLASGEESTVQSEAPTADFSDVRDASVCSLTETSAGDAGVSDGSSCSVFRAYSGSQKRLLQKELARWELRRSATESLKRQAELQDQLCQVRAQMAVEPPLPCHLGRSNRYGIEARLPDFNARVHAPTLALINPHSGAGAGRDILGVARRSTCHQQRFFNIVDVIKPPFRGGLMDVLREELENIKQEAKASGTRPRVISAGGDGTVSFALFVIFSALQADPDRAEDGLVDMGNGFLWSDDDLEAYFPAIVQMPLGTANDFGHTLGWGHKYPGCGGRGRKEAGRLLHDWVHQAMSLESRVANFDLWGIMPAAGHETCNFKLCELGGKQGWDPRVVVDGSKQLVMRPAKTPIPFLACLYFSAGFGAYMLARFHLNRRQHPLSNRAEYARQVAGILLERVPPQLNTGLEGVEVRCGDELYFPPRAEQQGAAGGRRYREVGFLNVNWQAGCAHGADRAPAVARLCGTREPAKFNDGKVDMFRLKATSVLKSGLRWQTDKRAGPVSLRFSGGKGKGVFFQWDGEARYAFSPDGSPFDIAVRKIMNVPVVLGPGFDARITGDPDNGAPVSFAFSGATDEERHAVRNRLLRCVRGELDAELAATPAELAAAGFHCH